MAAAVLDKVGVSGSARSGQGQGCYQRRMVGRHDGAMRPLQPDRRQGDYYDEELNGVGPALVMPGQVTRKRRAGPDPAADQGLPLASGPSRRLLVLGGTWFLGRWLAQNAVDRGWQVTCFNRGRTGRDVAGVRSVRGDRTRPDDVARLAQLGPWDAVVDTSVYEPPDAVLTARALRPVAARYVLVSTVSAYRQWPHEPVDESSPLWPSRSDARESDPDLTAMPGPYAYGTLKAGCEQAVREVFGDDALILRPGVILGPYEYVGRLPVLLGRAARGGRMLAAGDPGQAIQPVDVRDLTDFALDLVEAGTGEVFNVAAPFGHGTYGELLHACVEATGSDAELVWVDSDWLAHQDVRQWTEIPLWRTPAGTWAVDASRAHTVGLTCRPLRDTVFDTWRWLQDDQPVPHEWQGEHGLDPAKEVRLLGSWDAYQILRRG